MSIENTQQTSPVWAGRLIRDFDNTFQEVATYLDRRQDSFLVRMLAGLLLRVKE